MDLVRSIRITDVVNALHTINDVHPTGWPAIALLALVGFERDGANVSLWCLYRGSFYPFAPVTRPQQDSITGLRLRDLRDDEHE